MSHRFYLVMIDLKRRTVKAKRAKHLIVRAVKEFVDLFYAFQTR